MINQTTKTEGLEKTSKKLQVTEIWLERLEGKSEEQTLIASEVGSNSSCNSKKNIWQLANEILARWAVTAPTRGYDKVDFKVSWEDGETYEGRYSLKYHDIILANLGRHIHSFLMFYLEKPRHLSKENYQDILDYTLADNPCYIDDCSKMIKDYDIWLENNLSVN